MGNLLKNNLAKDPFWPKEGQRLNRLIIDILKMLLINTAEEEKFNLASVKSFLRNLQENSHKKIKIIKHKTEDFLLIFIEIPPSTACWLLKYQGNMPYIYSITS